MNNTPLYWINIVNTFAQICRDLELASNDDISQLRDLVLVVKKREISSETFYKTLGLFLKNVDEQLLMSQLNKYLQYNRFDAPLLYAMSAENLEQGIKDIVKNQEIILGSELTFKYVIKGKFVLITLADKAEYLSKWPYVYDVLFILFIFIARAIAGKKFEVQQIILPANRNTCDLTAIRSVSSAKIEFSNNTHKLGFNKEWLALQSFNNSDSERNRLEPELDQRKATLKMGISFAEKVMSIIKHSSSPTNITLAMVSQELGLSESHARKKLAEENTSFKYLCRWWLIEEAVKKLIEGNTKIDVIALELGYSERAPFERAFKAYLGISPSQFREISLKLGYADHEKFFLSKIEQLPPLPKTCRDLMQLPEKSMELEDVIEIVETDPIFSSRLLGLASRALFGAKPKSLKEAIGRNLGIEKVRQLALVFSAKDQLGNLVEKIDVSALTRAMIISQLIYVRCQKLYKYDSSQPADDYSLSMGLLGMYMLFHRGAPLHDELLHIYKNADNFADFMAKAHASFNVSVYQLSGVMLAVWGVSEEIIKELSIQGDLIRGKSHSENRYLYRILSNSIAMCVTSKTPSTPLELDLFEPISDSIDISELMQFAADAAKSLEEI